MHDVGFLMCDFRSFLNFRCFIIDGWFSMFDFRCPIFYFRLPFVALPLVLGYLRFLRDDRRDGAVQLHAGE